MKSETVQTTTIEKEMGITHKDFYGGLPHLLHDIPYDRSEDTTTFQFNHKKVEITLGPEKVRELGQSVRLPVTAVTIRLFDCSEEEVEHFTKCFTLSFMKGGG